MSFEFDRNTCSVIAEVAQAHDGSLGMAHAFIDAVANGGADAVKFQTHIAAAESSVLEPWRVRFSMQDASRFDYWRRMEFTEEQWHGLRKHALERGLAFLSSPFSTEAAELLMRVGVPAWKVASGEISNDLLFDFLLATRLPLLVSTGMSHVSEIDRTVARIRAHHVPFAVMQCTSKYPCPPEEIGLNVMRMFRKRYRAPVGLSDHSGTIYPSLAAATLGARFVEVHVTLTREAFGPDVQASVTTGELKQISEGVRFIRAMRATPVNKDAVAEELTSMRRLFTKSVAVCVELHPGTVLAREHLTVRKPGSGIPPERISELIGKRIRRYVAAGKFLSEEDVFSSTGPYDCPVCTDTDIKEPVCGF